jgi:formylglycine-generating enzyme required for sulfatase activity
MSPAPQAARHQRVKEILFAALDLPVEQRAAWLREACAGEEDLETEVCSLLTRYGDEDDPFLERPAYLDLDPAGRVLPERVGAYRVLRHLGFGGMGVVYLAEQDQPRRAVALKVLRCDAASPVVRKRFARESEVLGRLSHPAIARIYESGVADTEVGAQPYIAMEFVEGLPIHLYADRQGLSRDERVELVAQLADGVQHAHDAGVLHRDLKPDNVLVDGDGRPRILDFGVAHMAGEEEGASMITRAGQVLGTLTYMSPEQARGGQIDGRTDLFSLGVILYELLTGELPRETRGALPHDSLRAIWEDRTIPPSRHDASLRGDLETILLKALAGDPARRYRSVADLAADLRCFLTQRPIAARPPSRLYLVHKFVLRHKSASLGVALALVALIVGVGVVTQERAFAHARDQVASLFFDERLLERLEREADGLWPVTSVSVPAMEDWLRRARALGGRYPEHQARLAALSEAGREAGTQGYSPEFLRTMQVQMLDRIGAFKGSPEGWLAVIEARCVLARTARVRSIDQHAQAWAAATERVAASREYLGLQLRPQEGLVPVGPDPQSGLEEFAYPDLTGELPARGPDGTLQVNGDSCLVFVLLPGGPTSIGCQNRDPEAPRYDPCAERHELGLHEVELDPFFCSKYEMTQGQWLRLAGVNPSYWEAKSTHDGVELGTESYGWANPVENVEYPTCLEVLARLACTLPTEAQWEYAARGASDLPFVLEENGDRIERVGNTFADPCKDGYQQHAPVGSFPPNGFGLHDAIGNVWEWCLDNYKVDYFKYPLRAGDGLVLAPINDTDRSRRGGSYSAAVAKNRVAHRGDRIETSESSQIGLRPVRAYR